MPSNNNAIIRLCSDPEEKTKQEVAIENLAPFHLSDLEKVQGSQSYQQRQRRRKEAIEPAEREMPTHSYGTRAKAKALKGGIAAVIGDVSNESQSCIFQAGRQISWHADPITALLTPVCEPKGTKEDHTEGGGDDMFEEALVLAAEALRLKETDREMQGRTSSRDVDETTGEQGQTQPCGSQDKQDETDQTGQNQETEQTDKIDKAMSIESLD